MYEQLLLWGAGAQLEQWRANCVPGHQPYLHIWVETPATYMLVGIYGHGPSTGVEQFKSDYTAHVDGKLDLYLYWDSDYWDSDANRYTLGAPV